MFLWEFSFVFLVLEELEILLVRDQTNKTTHEQRHGGIKNRHFLGSERH